MKVSKGDWPDGVYAATDVGCEVTKNEWAPGFGLSITFIEPRRPWRFCISIELWFWLIQFGWFADDAAKE